MKQTMLLKLAPTPGQHAALLEPMHACNAAANAVAAVAFAKHSANKFALQKQVYGTLRTTYKLPAQLAIRCTSKASAAYKRDKSIQPAFKPGGATVYDERVTSFKSLTVFLYLVSAGYLLEQEGNI